jgi:hypothetical protein
MSWGENMKAGMCGVAVLMGAMGIVTDAAAVPENNSSLAPLIPHLFAAARSTRTSP